MVHEDNEEPTNNTSRFLFFVERFSTGGRGGYRGRGGQAQGQRGGRGGDG